MSYKLGLCSISFRNYTPKEILIAMKNAGLSHIEWGSDIHAPYKDIEKLYELEKLQKEYDIKCGSYGTYFRIDINLAEELQEYINAAKILGTNILRLWCGNKNSEEYTLEEKMLLFDECKRLAEIAKNNDVILCMECHGGTYTNTKESAYELMKTIDSKHFRMYWQPNQFKDVDENISYAEKISPFTENIHVFNWEKENRYPLNMNVDVWKNYLKCFDNDKVLLLEFMPDDRIESLIDESNALKLIAKRGNL